MATEAVCASVYFLRVGVYISVTCMFAYTYTDLCNNDVSVQGQVMEGWHDVTGRGLYTSLTHTTALGSMSACSAAPQLRHTV